MDHISPILDEILKRAHLKEGLANHGLLPRWEKVVGAHLAKSTRPIRVRGNTLIVYVENSTLLHHLTYLIPQLLEKIRKEAPDSTIRKVYFSLNPEA